MPEYTLIMIRSIIAFLVIFIVARLLGKKQISQLTFFDYVVGISIGSMASAIAINPRIKVPNGMIALGVFALFPILIAYFAAKSFTFRKIVEGAPTILIENGKVLENNIIKSKLTFDDLMIKLREKNAFKVADVELAVLETDGKVSVMKKANKQPVTPKDLGLLIEEEHQPQLVIIDGKVFHQHLKRYGYSKEWLLGEIKKQGANDFYDVFLAQLDSKGNVYVDLYNDKQKQEKVKQRPLLAAKLRKVQADLETFALQTNDQNAKNLYFEQSQELTDLIQKMNPYLK